MRPRRVAKPNVKECNGQGLAVGVSVKPFVETRRQKEKLSTAAVAAPDLNVFNGR